MTETIKLLRKTTKPKSLSKNICLLIFYSSMDMEVEVEEEKQRGYVNQAKAQIQMVVTTYLAYLVLVMTESMSG